MTTILIIEDDEQTAKLIRILLRSTGYIVSHATNGPKGIELARELQPSLIIVDMRLPGINGWDVIRMIKKHDELRDIPTIALTVPTSPEDQRRAFDAGVDEYITKPFQGDKLVERIKSYIENN